MSGKPWTNSEIALLRDMYPHCNTYDVAAWLGRQPSSVYQAAQIRDIRKTGEYLESTASGRMQTGRTNPGVTGTQFKKGLIPWNKGKKHDPPGVDQYRFKKGNKPASTLPVGSFRVRAETYARGHVLQQKISDAPGLRAAQRWWPVSRVVWERENGPIPDGHIVVFKSKALRTTVLEEITTDRLECISRAEHARRNDPKNHSPEMASLYQLKGAINRQLRRIEREQPAHQPTA